MIAGEKHLGDFHSPEIARAGILGEIQQAVEYGLTDNSLVVWLPADLSTATRISIMP